jgi:putative DNA methylase
MAAYRKKLIEAALPLDAINAESAREKSIRHGHPSTLHLWWARRPLAACRAVLFASLVDDPAEPDAPPAYLAALDELPKPASLPLTWDSMTLAEQRRERLFTFIAKLVRWENSTNEYILATARNLIHLACEGNPPPVLDPFCGGGSIPLEAQRLGLEAHASDLNPVAVLITKALIEIPPKFAGRPPVNPEARRWKIEDRGGESHALQATGGVAEGDGPSAGDLPHGAGIAAGGTVRDSVPDDTRGRLDPGEHRRGLGERVGQGEGAVPGRGTGFAGGAGDAGHPVRADRLVSSREDSKDARDDDRGRQDADGHAPQPSLIAAVGPSYLSPTSSFSTSYRGAAGLAADVRYYGKWMRDEAERRIGHLYPKVTPPSPARGRGVGGEGLTVIAWLWARTVRCPNPACGAMMPLVRSFWLSTKPGRKAWVEPVVDPGQGAGQGRSGSPPVVRFTVKTGAGRPPDGTVNRRGATCIVCGAAVPFAHVRAEGKAGRMGAQLMAIVAEGERGRIYLPPDEEHERIATQAEPSWRPEAQLPRNPRDFKTPNYGMSTFADLFTPRQLVALTTFSDLVAEARERVLADARAAGLPDDGVPLTAGGTGATAYADAVAVYLAFALSRFADSGCALATWQSVGDKVAHAFARQALPMVWDFAEVNPFSNSTRNFLDAVQWVAESLDAVPAGPVARIWQGDATALQLDGTRCVMATDPPYYDNVGYADLSDFFYVWLRRALAPVFPDLFRTVLTPKTQELVATPYRFGGSKEGARRFFEEGLGRTFRTMRAAAHPDYPVTVFYAFKQAEEEDSENGNGGDAGAVAGNGTANGVASTGWETMLSGLIGAGFQITATWPMRTERGVRSNALGANALASSIVLACRPRPLDAPVATRAEFLRELAEAMRAVLPVLASGQVAPVDLAQASIGPGMAVYSKYRQVVRQDGRPVTVREALADINNAIASYRSERVSVFDGETRFCIDWYSQYGWAEGQYGDADNLARAYNVGPNAMERDGLLDAARGRVRLERPSAYPVGVAGLGERAFHGSAWEACLRLAVTLQQEGEAGAAALVRELGEGVAARARELAVWLYTIADGKKRTEDAFLFNALDASWAGIQEQVSVLGEREQQSRLL